MLVMMLMAGDAGGMNLWKIIWNASPVSKVVFGVLVLSSLWSIAVIVERWIVLNRARRATEQATAQLDAWMAGQQFAEARETIGQAARGPQPLLAVLRAGIASWDEMVATGETRIEMMEEMVIGAVGRELKLVKTGLRANLPVLANIASVAPFIGLFGTVVGIILTFNAIAREGNMGQELVASGIADALVATAMGLFAAIPAVVAYNFFTERINQVVLQMESAALERIYFLVQREPTAAPAGRK